MPRFREPPVLPPALSALSPGPEALRAVIAEVFRPAHFLLGPGLELTREHHPTQETSWELFQGQLLDPAQTRRRAVFEAWEMYLVGPEGRSGEPLLALKLDEAAGRLYVVRGLECYVWEAYDSGGNVILSREGRKWVRELAGTIDLARFAGADDLSDELICLLFHAVVGASRLPLTSVEAPLPGFAFGELFYCYRPDAAADAGPARGWRALVEDLLTRRLSPSAERPRLLETFLHAVPAEEMPTAVGRWLQRDRRPGEAPAYYRLRSDLYCLFYDVSLTPWTDLTDKVLALLRALERIEWATAEEVADFLSWLLRMLGRHLTAYDLTTFHHRGANYPDALLLDAALKAYLALAERRPDLFRGWEWNAQLRRRALRQGWLLRRAYEGHPVPDLPTSPGENSRVLPPSHPRVPQEQIDQPARRSRRLYSGDPLAASGIIAELLTQSIRDFAYPAELRELGKALFLDRPLGAGKAPTEPDQTPLLATLAFSRSIAERRLEALARETAVASELPLIEASRRRLREGVAQGLPCDQVGGAPRPGKASLADARRAAPDFVLLHASGQGVPGLLRRFDGASLLERFGPTVWLGPLELMAADETGRRLRVYDERHQPRLLLEVAAEEGYRSRGGEEVPAAGLRVLRVWEGDGPGLCEHDLSAAPIALRPLE
jgi:hypothetical protein